MLLKVDAFRELEECFRNIWHFTDIITDVIKSLNRWQWCSFVKTGETQPCAIDIIVFVETLDFLAKFEVALNVVVISKYLMAENAWTLLMINESLNHQYFTKTSSKALAVDARTEASGPATRNTLSEGENVRNCILSKECFVRMDRKRSESVVTATEKHVNPVSLRDKRGADFKNGTSVGITHNAVRASDVTAHGVLECENCFIVGCSFALVSIHFDPSRNTEVKRFIDLSCRKNWQEKSVVGSQF